MAWKALCQPMLKGRLGLKQFKNINIVLLAKLAWKLAIIHDAFWVKCFKVKYVRDITIIMKYGTAKLTLDIR